MLFATMSRLFRPLCSARIIACEVLSSRGNSFDVRCRTPVDDPSIHKDEHESLFYTLPPEIVTKLFTLGGIPKSYESQAKSFRETSLMIRKPALEIIKHMKTADYSCPAIRYVVYGEPGSGKSLSLAHVLHYGLNSDHLLVHVPWVPEWFKYCRTECTASSAREGFIDTPINAAKWLGHFRIQNLHLLSNPDLTVSNEYVWSKREITSPGSPLLELVNLGINRIKYASEIVVALMKEIKTLSTAGKCKTLVAIDGVNIIFGQKSQLKGEDGTYVSPSRVVLTEALLNITRADWCNGSMVLVVDRLAFRDKDVNSDLPFLQLGKEGFEHVDPFVPVQVTGYSEKEFHSCIDYYLDRHWIQSEKANTEEGRKELLYLCVKNPYELMNICNPL